MIRIGSNISALKAERQLGRVSDSLADTYERLSSGMRINRASDDAAGVAIADGLRADSRIYSQGIRNLNDGISALNISQETLQQLSSIVVRQMELSEQAANGTYSLSQRKALHTEANALMSEFNRIVGVTSFNGRNLLDVSFQDFRLQGGYGSDGTVGFSLGNEFKRKIGTGTFSAAYSIASAANTQMFDMVQGDFNGDGNLDLVSVGTGTAISVSLGNGDGTFRAVVSYEGGTNSRAISLGDFNEDGIADLAVASSGDSRLSIFLGNSDGTFQARSSIAMGTGYMWYMQSADVNGDGHMDLVGSDNATSTLSVWLGNGNTTFRAPVNYYSSGTAGNDSRRPTLADVNNDGVVDILVTNIDDNSAMLLLGNGNGTFRAGNNLLGSGGISDPLSMAVRDIDNDGIVDIVLGGNNAILSLIGNGDGTFRIHASYGSQNITDVVLTDMNGDGQLDIVGHGDSGSNVYVNFGNGDGTFRVQSSTAAGSGILKSVVGDFNGDGVPDIGVARNDAGSQIAMYSGNTSNTTTEEYLYLLSADGGRQALTTLQGYMTRINNELGSIGAFQSRVETAVRNLGVSKENFLSAESRIRDVDVASETSDLVRKQILQKAAAAVLNNASLTPKIALQLLKG